MTGEQASALREEIKSTMIASDNPGLRRETLNLLRQLDKRVAEAPASVEQRTASAREFLRPPVASASVKGRAWAAAVELHGSEREAERRGYKRPT